MKWVGGGVDKWVLVNKIEGGAADTRGRGEARRGEARRERESSHTRIIFEIGIGGGGQFFLLQQQ